MTDLAGPEAVVSDGATSTVFDVTMPRAPYPGLRPFERREWPIFFGREAITAQIVDRVVERQLIVVHGDSGCGKSSIVSAGVLAGLEQDYVRGGMSWRGASVRPGNNPLGNVARALAPLRGDRDADAGFAALRRILNYGRQAPLALAEHLGCGRDTHVFLLIDQFEELFAFARRGGDTDAKLLTQMLVGMTERPPPGLYVLLTMRSEFLGACARFDGFAEAVNATQFLLPRMAHKDLLRAIQTPATLYDGVVATDLAERLIAETGSNPDQLPLIQHGLMMMWERAPVVAGRRRLEIPQYDTARGLAAMLSNHADALMERSLADGGADAPRAIAHLFRALTDITAEGSGIRRPQRFADLVAVTGAPSRWLAGVIDRFRAEGASFLAPFDGDPLADDTLVDISHEAFLRCWTRIGDPKTGWLRAELLDGLRWRTLLLGADDRTPMPDTAVRERTAWMQKLTPRWAERYGGRWNDVREWIEASRRANLREAARGRRKNRLIAAAFGLLAVTLGIVAYSARVTVVQQQALAALTEKQAELSKALAKLDRQKRHAERAAKKARRAEQDARAILHRLRTAKAKTEQALDDLRQTQANVVATKREQSGATTPAASNKPRLYIQVSKFTPGLSQLQDALKREGVDAPVQIVELPMPDHPELRYFKSTERDEAMRLTAHVRAKLPDVVPTYVKGFEHSTRIRPNHFELWSSSVAAPAPPAAARVDLLDVANGGQLVSWKGRFDLRCAIDGRPDPCPTAFLPRWRNLNRLDGNPNCATFAIGRGGYAEFDEFVVRMETDGNRNGFAYKLDIADPNGTLHPLIKCSTKEPCTFPRVTSQSIRMCVEKTWGAQTLRELQLLGRILP